jgi:DNA replicative helicase MCM subunit Mcm2 (Cdc46/Mcm family)
MLTINLIRTAPIAIYTSGKGSSASGLTASIVKDPSTGININFYFSM